MTDKEEALKAVFSATSKPKNNDGQININGNLSGNVTIGNNNTVINMSEVTKQPKTRIVFQSTEQHISQEQKCVLKSLVHELHELEKNLKKNPKSFAAIWSALNKTCSVTQYDAILKEDFEKAKKYLQQQIAMRNSTKSASKKSPDWRRKRTIAIQTICKTYGFEDKMRAYILKNFNASSLTHLIDDDIERTYKYVTGLKRKK